MPVNAIAINSFNSNHQSYDLHRPSFHKKLVDSLLVGLKVATRRDNQTVYETNKKILEVAAGTGKFTRNLVESGWRDNLSIVEPSKGMVESFQKNFPQIKTYLSSSYEIPLPDNSVDTVIIAQAFHWFSDEKSLKEINRVIKPGGTFGCIWNYDYCTTSQVLREPLPEVEILFEGVDADKQRKVLEGKEAYDPKELPLEIGKKFFDFYPWHNAVTSYIYQFDINVPQYRHGKWRDVLSGDKEYFDTVSKEKFLFYFVLTDPEDVFNYWKTRSYITDLPDEERLKVKEKVESLVRLAQDSEKVDVDEKTFLRKALGTHAVVLNAKK